MVFRKSALASVALYLSAVVQSTPVNTASDQHFCPATKNWPGWGGIKYAFIFGDSYTTVGFNTNLTQPTLDNPLGNPTYPGWTSANGPNWVDYLTVKYNATKTLTYDIAYGGATIDSSLVAPYLPIVSSITDQVKYEWYPAYASKPASAPWKSSDTLFAFFDGINDVGNSYGKGNATTTPLYVEIFGIYAELVEIAYEAGGRNFAFLNVPPVDRSPLTIAQGASAQALEKAAIADWNCLIKDMAKKLKSTHPDANVFTVDAWLAFTEVLDRPSSFPQTALYKNTTNYCVVYEYGTSTTDYFDPSCGIPVNEYFWLNSLHPTYPMHDVLAEVVAKQLKAGPNVC